jgi:hypothetical protein
VPEATRWERTAERRRLAQNKRAGGNCGRSVPRTVELQAQPGLLPPQREGCRAVARSAKAEAWLSQREWDFDQHQHRHRPAASLAWHEPPQPDGRNRLLIQAVARVERSQHGDLAGRAVRADDGL